MEFNKYMHLERLGTTEVQEIMMGECYVFPKLDGTNASVWMDDDGEIQAGSRNRHLTLDNDNAGFLAWVRDQDNLREYFADYPNDTLYGEWLVPHSLKTYRDDAWRKFYVFDVMNAGVYGHFEQYVDGLDQYGIDYLSPIAIVKNGTADLFTGLLEKNTYLIKDGEGAGEGIVIKNYDFTNKYGRRVWAKLVTSAFKEKHFKEMGAPILKGADIIEIKIVDKYVTQELVDKVYAKISLDGGWSSKMIPRLLQTVFYDLVKEETWEFVKENKNPKIDFGTLQRFTFAKVKKLRSDIFK